MLSHAHVYMHTYVVHTAWTHTYPLHAAHTRTHMFPPNAHGRAHAQARRQLRELDLSALQLSVDCAPSLADRCTTYQQLLCEGALLYCQVGLGLGWVGGALVGWPMYGVAPACRLNPCAFLSI